VCDVKRPPKRFGLLMETTSKPKVTIPLVAAISIPYINFFRGKVEANGRVSLKASRTQPYTAIDCQRSSERKACSSCSSRDSASGEQTKANQSVSNMYNNGTPMLILPFVSAKPSQIQQKALPSVYQHSLSAYPTHAKKADDSSRVI
jgi:hypothetical protein